jgi:hypothetical protein
LQVTVEEAQHRPRTHGVACQVLRMGYKGFKGGSLHRNICVADMEQIPGTAVRDAKKAPANIVSTFLAGV